MAEKIYYSMGEVAEMLCVSPSLVRFWEKRFDIIAPRKNKKGNRLFSPEDVRNLKTIYHLTKERGMTLAGAEKQLKARRGGIERDMEIAERLGAIRALLVEVRNELGGNENYELRITNYEESDEGEDNYELRITNYELQETETVEVVIPVIEPVEVVVERVAVAESEPEPAAEPERTPEPEATSEPEATPKPEATSEPDAIPKPATTFIEQTLF
jgi:DNA-binding transcriptional MerR regulator